MSVLFVLVWNSRKWPWHFLSKHREMAAHSTATWEHPKPDANSDFVVFFQNSLFFGKAVL
jgi:hypothetical protein